jgi:biotin operon repressor
MANEEQIGFHKGSLTTLIKEREELARLLQIVNTLMQAHVKALKDLGIDIEKELKKKSSLDEKIV